MKSGRRRKDEATHECITPENNDPITLAPHLISTTYKGVWVWTVVDRPPARADSGGRELRGAKQLPPRRRPDGAAWTPHHRGLG